MKKYLQVEAYVSFQQNFLQVEELGGINETYIVFNPDYSSGNPDYKIQFAEKMLLKKTTSHELIPIGEMEDDFVIINSAGDDIADSDNLRPEFADFILEMVVNNVSFEDVEISHN